MTAKPLKVLLCGHRAFAARGLRERLRADGHEVVCFSRGPLRADGDTVSGPVDAVHENPHLQRAFDTVVNYILVKDGSIDENLAYLDSLLELCRRGGVGHLLHISSVSVHKGSVRVVNEAAAVETDPSRKGSYGGLKVATESHVRDRVPEGVKLSLVRPGFVLGAGLESPIVGMAFRLPWNRLLLLGSPRNQVPLTTRAQLNEAVATVVASPPEDRRETLMIADGASPTRREYLEACCTRLGCGTAVTSLPVPLWLAAAVGGEIVARAARMSLRPLRIIGGACRTQSFDSSLTARRLGLDLSVDWRRALEQSSEGQTWNFELPYEDLPPGKPAFDRIVFLGYGRVVKQKHLPALGRLGFRGVIDAYDLEARTDADGRRVRAVGELEPRRALFVVASPGPAHVEAVDRLAGSEGPVLVEKPLGYCRDDLERWRAVARERTDGVFVCHNYRFKANVAAMVRHLRRFNPGRLHHVHLEFQSLPVSSDGAAWMRDERGARTLVMDYSLHFLDLATMFAAGEWKPGDVRFEIDARGNTSLIEGHFDSERYRVTFLLRQGFMPRRARLLYTFQNYQVSLGFFPDTFVPFMAHDNASLYAMERRASARATRRKVLDRLTGRDSDGSHAAALLAAGGDGSQAGGAIAIEQLAAFYQGLYALAEKVYGERLPVGT